MADCPLSGRGQGHVNNFYILDLEKISPEQVVINKLVDGQLVDYTYDGRPVVAECATLLYVVNL